MGSIPPRIEVSSDDVDELPPVPLVDDHDDFSSSKYLLAHELHGSDNGLV